MKRTHYMIHAALGLLVLAGSARARQSAAKELPTLWQVGKPDNDTAEFALARGGYRDYRSPGFFVVGQSDAKKDWPYVQPGVADGRWTSGLPQTFEVLFGLAKAPTAPCRLVLDFADTHSSKPPHLRVAVNDATFERQTPAGAGDASVRGNPSKGRGHAVAIDVPASVLKAGDNRVAITTTAGSWVLWDALTFEAPGGTTLRPVAQSTIDTARQQARRRNQPWPNLERVVVVFKTHFDIGYTEMAKEVVARYRTSMIDQALEVVDQNRGLPSEQQFVWTIPGWPMAQVLWDGQTPERRRRVLEAFRQGRFVVHALPFTLHTETLELEDLVRGLGFSSRLSRQIDQPLPRDAKMTDVPSHSWAIPTLLKHAGVDFLHLGCNSGSSSPTLPMLFWWEGPDGSRLLTMYSEQGYGTGLTPPADWPYKTWLALVHTGDNHGPPRPDAVKRLLEEARRRLPGVKVTIGRLSDFGDAILAEDPKLPVVRGDMPDTWIHGPMSDPIGWKNARTIRPAIAASEVLDTQLDAWGVSAKRLKDKTASAYEHSLLYGEHTWGGSLGWVGSRLVYGQAWQDARAAGRFARNEASWEEHTDYIRKTRELIEPALTREMAALADAVDVDGPRIVVFNPLPWPRDGLVSLEGVKFDAGALKAVDDGGLVPVDHCSGSVRFTARAVPASGYRTYVPAAKPAAIAEERPAADGDTIQSPFFIVKLDKRTGTIASLVDRRDGKQYVDRSAPHGFGQYLYERFDRSQTDGYTKAYVKGGFGWAIPQMGKPYLPSAADAPYRASTPGPFDLAIERGCSAVSAVMKAPARAEGLHALTTTVTLYHDRPCIDIAVTLHDKPADSWPEGGWLCMPLAIDDPLFRLGRLGGIVAPATDVVEGSNHHLHCLNGGMAVVDQQGRGLGICPLDSPLVSLGEPGLWKYSRQFAPRRPDVYINLFNNQWSTNFRFWNSGTWTSRVRIWPIENYRAEHDLITPSWEARSPLLAAASEAAGGSLPPVQTGLALSRRGVLVTAFGPNPDGEGLILRLWEQAGQAGPITVTLPNGMAVRSAQPADLRGRPVGDPIAIEADRFAIPLGRFAPATLLLRP